MMCRVMPTWHFHKSRISSFRFRWEFGWKFRWEFIEQPLVGNSASSIHLTSHLNFHLHLNRQKSACRQVAMSELAALVSAPPQGSRGWVRVLVLVRFIISSLLLFRSDKDCFNVIILFFVCHVEELLERTDGRTAEAFGPSSFDERKFVLCYILGLQASLSRSSMTTIRHSSNVRFSLLLLLLLFRKL